MMNVQGHCKLIHSTLTHNLRLATTEDERQQFLSLALNELGSEIVPALNHLMDQEGEGSTALRDARTAALDLTTFVCIDFVRKCTNHRWGVSCLEEVTEKCREPQLKKKLVVYTNQLKKRWNDSEPGGISHAPRAVQFRRSIDKSNFPAYAGLILFLLVIFYFFAHFDLTNLIFPAWNQPEEKPQRQVVVRQQGQAPSQTEEQEALPPVTTSETSQSSSARKFYSYSDKQGVVHIVDDLEKVPHDYRQAMKVTVPAIGSSNVTPVIIKGNQVLVPVKLSLRGRSVDARLLLDTGASVTTISERLGALLGAEGSDLKPGQAMVADGRKVGSYSFWLDSLTVGSRSLSRVQASILPGSGSDGYDGLLGMNFLKNFRYHVDFNRSVIEWGG